LTFFPDGDAGAFGDSAGGEIFGVDQGNQTLGFQLREGPVAAGDGGFGGETLVPEVAAQVISDFVGGSPLTCCRIMPQSP
jgi:hypothetical protein